MKTLEEILFDSCKRVMKEGKPCIELKCGTIITLEDSQRITKMLGKEDNFGYMSFRMDSSAVADVALGYILMEEIEHQWKRGKDFIIIDLQRGGQHEI